MLLQVSLTFLGLLIGVFLSKYTRDEIKEGKKYFLISYKVLLIILVLLGLFYAWYLTYYYLILAFIAGIVISFVIKEIYFYFGILVAFSFFKRPSYSNYMMIFTFAAGLIRGALLGYKFKFSKKLVKKLIISLVFFAIPFISLYYKNSLNGLENTFLGFAAGALFMKFLRRINI